MQIKMDTDAVRTMSSRFRHTADSIDAGLSSIKTTVESADWQSQAREEFIMRLEMLRRTSSQSAAVLRMMAQAADRKAEQWEAIANIFNGPFQYLGNIWNSVVAFFSGIGSNIWNAITSIRLPSLPKLVLPSISGAAIIGGITNIIPKWEWNPPDWWPFPKGGNAGHSAGGGGGGSGGGAWGEDDSRTEGNSNDTSSASGNPSPPIEKKPYPQPPTTPKLTEVNGKPSSYTCATYAKDRRPDLGSTQSDFEAFHDGAAANYISKFEDTAFQIDNSGEDLTNIVGPGYALVWEPDHPSADNTYGHVAIIEEVFADHVVISEAYRLDGVYQIRMRSISVDQLNNDLVWLIP